MESKKTDPFYEIHCTDTCCSNERVADEHNSVIELLFVSEGQSLGSLCPTRALGG